jgi:hypothetical protein
MENQRDETQDQPGNVKSVGDVIKRLPMKNTLPASPGNPLKEQAASETPCEICRGAHFIHPSLAEGGVDYSRVIPCQCIRTKLEEEKRKRMLRMCELPPKARSWTFARPP